MKMYKISFIVNDKLHTVVIEAKNKSDASIITIMEYGIKMDNIYEIVEIKGGEK